MLGITSSQPVHWPPATSPAVAPVTPVGAVTPAQSQARDTPSGFGSGREGRAGTVPDTTQDKRLAADKSAPESQAAPILPRQQPEGGRQGEAASNAEKTRERGAKLEVEEKVAEQPPLPDVLASVWKASAAVVDVILGRDAASDKVNAVANAEKVESLDSPVSQQVATSASALPGSSGQQPNAEPVTYSEQGSSVWGAIETGTRLNQKV